MFFRKCIVIYNWKGLLSSNHFHWIEERMDYTCISGRYKLIYVRGHNYDSLKSKKSKKNNNNK